jgi:hypothetical protein
MSTLTFKFPVKLHNILGVVYDVECDVDPSEDATYDHPGSIGGIAGIQVKLHGEDVTKDISEFILDAIEQEADRLYEEGGDE